jgi:predicted nucleic acid-binding protein
MILVDTSVWIDNLRKVASPAVLKLREIPTAEILVGDIILFEVLRGARDDRHAANLEAALRSFQVVTMLTPDLAPVAGWHDRTLRSLGISVRKPQDIIIGTFCIAHDHVLLQSDRDFQPMVEHLGLRLA